MDTIVGVPRAVLRRSGGGDAILNREEDIFFLPIRQNDPSKIQSKKKDGYTRI